MEYVDGESLASIIRGRGALPADETVRIGRQIAEALDHAHQRGVLHRDLKGANIVCDARGHAKILDFGIARRLPPDIAADVTRTETGVAAAPGIEGTLAYMAPEVIRGRGQDERSDLWALGVVLFEMLTGATSLHRRQPVRARRRDPRRAARRAAGSQYPRRWHTSSRACCRATLPHDMRRRQKPQQRSMHSADHGRRRLHQHRDRARAWSWLAAAAVVDRRGRPGAVAARSARCSSANNV